MNTPIAALLPVATLLAQATGNEEADFAFLIEAFLVAYALVFVAIGVVWIIGVWKVLAKAGQPGCAVLIPIYNLVVLLRVAGLPWYWMFAPCVAIIPILGWIAYLVWVAWVQYRIATRFGQGFGFTLGLTLLGPIFWLILGFGSAKYLGEQTNQN